MQTLKFLCALLLLSMGSASAQIGWTLDQCRKHWGPESIFRPINGEPTEYTFGSKIQKQVTLDQQGKVNDVLYIGPSEGAGFLKIAQLLEKEQGVHWLGDPDPNSSHSFDPKARLTPGQLGYRHAYWIGYKDGVAVFHARYFFGKRDVNATTWGESLHVLPIDSPL